MEAAVYLVKTRHKVKWMCVSGFRDLQSAMSKQRKKSQQYKGQKKSKFSSF